MNVSTEHNQTRQNVSAGICLPLMEAFYTIQGEGFNTGKAAYFIRLAGCDVGCHWCDVKESWEAEQHPVIEVEQIVRQAAQYPTNLAVVTGGEPAMYQLDKLTEALIKKGLKPCIETSGAHALTGDWHWICLSPKKMSAPVEGVHRQAHELKIIIYNKNDLKWAEEHAEKVSEGCKLFLQPEWGKRKEMMPLVTEYVKNHPKWQVSLQTHKYLNIP